jgi:hypothetical protein
MTLRRDGFGMEGDPFRATSGTRTVRPQPRADAGTVALAISGMTLYWIAPLMAGGRRRRRPRGAAQQPPSPGSGPASGS